MTTKAKNFLDFAGIWADMPEKEWKAFAQGVQQARNGLHASLKKKIRMLRK